MKQFVRLFAVLALIGAGWWLWNVLFPAPEVVIRKRLNELAALVSFGPNEGPLAKLANSQKIANYLAPEVEAIIDLPGRSVQSMSGRDELVQAAMGARNQLSSLNVDFPDMVITVSPDKRTARVNLTAQARTPNERDRFVQEMLFSMEKMGGDWVISRIKTEQTLK